MKWPCQWYLAAESSFYSDPGNLELLSLMQGNWRKFQFRPKYDYWQLFRKACWWNRWGIRDWDVKRRLGNFWESGIEMYCSDDPAPYHQSRHSREIWSWEEKKQISGKINSFFVPNVTTFFINNFFLKISWIFKTYFTLYAILQKELSFHSGD